MDLDQFNRAAQSDAHAAAMVWAAIPAWADALVAGRPYTTVRAAARAAERAAASWSLDELDAALAHHPRIGQHPGGRGAEAAASRREQSAMAGVSDELAAAMAEANAAYEERFGRVFLIRAAGRTPEEMLDDVHRRLVNDPETEAAEALEQLAQIAVLRLRQALGVEASVDAMTGAR